VKTYTFLLHRTWWMICDRDMRQTLVTKEHSWAEVRNSV